jgi:hypothetical protein
MRTVNYGWKKRTIFYSKFPRGRLYIHWPVITEVVQELKSFHIIFTYTTIIIGYRNAQASTAKHVVHFQLCFVMYIYRQVQKGRTFLPSWSVYIYGIRYRIITQSRPCTIFHVTICQTLYPRRNDEQVRFVNYIFHSTNIQAK